MIIAKESKTKGKVDNKLSKKRDRRKYSAQRYQTKKEWYHEWYLQKKTKKEQQEKETNNKLYQTNNIKVLMSLKDYSETSQENKEKWLNFVWTFKDLNEKGFHDIIQIMKMREEADNLINDYWETAKNKVIKGRNWSNLTNQQ